MKKIMIIDGGPRKNFNTAALMDAVEQGVRSVSAEIEVKRVRLYDVEFTGCRACYACKVKDKWSTYCKFRDAMTETLQEADKADGLVFASPTYFQRITGRLEQFLERLLFPRLSYNDYSSLAPRLIPTVTIYTMTGPQPAVEKFITPFMDHTDGLIEKYYGKPVRLTTVDDFQVKDYSRYEMASFDLVKKQQWHDAHWQEDIDRAFAAGKKMAEEILRQEELMARE